MSHKCKWNGITRINPYRTGLPVGRNGSAAAALFLAQVIGGVLGFAIALGFLSR